MIMEQEQHERQLPYIHPKTVVEKRGEKMDKSKIYHFTGIKGSGMSALALVLHGKAIKRKVRLRTILLHSKRIGRSWNSILPFSA